MVGTMNEENETYNAEDPKQYAAAQKKAQREKYQREETIRLLMSKKDGRAWVHHILVQGDMFGNPHVRGDPYDTAFNIGMANLAKLIWQDVEAASPESCLLMIKEAKQNEKPDPSDAA